MNDSTCPRPCLMKLDLQSSTNKLAFLKDNWPSFGQIESIDRLSETELRCIPFACWMWCWLLWLKMNASVRIGKSFVWY